MGCNLAATYNDCFIEALIAEAERDKEIVAISAGLGIDQSLQLFRSRFPERFFDVGLAEQHAVTFAAGLSCGGLKPFCIIPSTFLQRAYDQVVFALFYFLIYIHVCFLYFGISYVHACRNVDCLENFISS